MKRAERRARQARREARLADRERRPALRAGEVFVTGGKCFHTEWCSCVNGVWLSGAETLRAVPRAAAVGKEHCGVCLELVAA